ncbi:MAG: MFS transporter [Acidimicrobiales bacterium]|nr:MFS transporter [Acidimicrobiales bacterium]
MAAPATINLELVQRRTLRILFTSSISARAATSVMFFIAVLAIDDILGSGRWAGLTTVAMTLGTAYSSSALSSFMDRHGRNPGLTLGYAVAVGGSLVAALGTQLQMVPVLLIGMAGVGVGQGSTNLSRYAAADLAPPTQRSRAISFVVFASTIGAVTGPLFAGPSSSLAERIGYEELAGPFIAGAIFFAISGLIVQAGLRPDPLSLAQEADGAQREKQLGFMPALNIVLASAGARLGLITLTVSTAVMVSVMAMTPLHMEAHGHGTDNIGWVISAHTAGMFAFAPLAGWYSDRKGRLPAVFVGSVILLISTIVAALAVDAPNILMFPSLYLLGLGWSFGIVAGSALVTESVKVDERVSAQGAADVASALASGVGALSSGFVFSMAGFHILSLLGTAAAGGLLLLAFVRTRTEQLTVGV